jgi:adenine-specific DNA-methyltransferase|tara:strand:+ start:4486 stop:5529 length:1044 start_codon:yes stop_codon:yes gene_type:complete
MSFRYIGSKARVVEAIIENIGPSDGGVFVDAFSGTGAVAGAASRAGWPVHVNDHLFSSAIMSYARVMSSTQAGFVNVGGYHGAIEKLNSASPRPGFIWREYSPASSAHCGIERMYFTEQNARKIDGVRSLIAEMVCGNLIGDVEEKILLADLLLAANRVANTAGTYGCFLSKWQRQSLETLSLKPRKIPDSLPKAKMSHCDVLDVPCSEEDTVYLDPPYTKRQYAAYYHILETIALGDEPTVEGVCGIRPWQHIASDYCYKVRAANALEQLVAQIPARRIFLSYSTEGHVPLPVLNEAFQGLGDVVMHHLDAIGRYRPNRAASEAGSKVSEVLFFIEKPAAENREAA